MFGRINNRHQTRTSLRRHHVALRSNARLVQRSKISRFPLVRFQSNIRKRRQPIHVRPQVNVRPQIQRRNSLQKSLIYSNDVTTLPLIHKPHQTQTPNPVNTTPIQVKTSLPPLINHPVYEAKDLFDKLYRYEIWKNPNTPFLSIQNVFVVWAFQMLNIKFEQVKTHDDVWKRIIEQSIPIALVIDSHEPFVFNEDRFQYMFYELNRLNLQFDLICIQYETNRLTTTFPGTYIGIPDELRKISIYVITLNGAKKLMTKPFQLPLEQFLQSNELNIYTFQYSK